MKRATSIAGLLRQAIALRWNAASRGAKFAFVALVGFVSVAGAQALVCGACGGGCHAAAESNAAPVAVEAVESVEEADEEHGCRWTR